MALVFGNCFFQKPGPQVIAGFHTETGRKSYHWKQVGSHGDWVCPVGSWVSQLTWERNKPHLMCYFGDDVYELNFSKQRS